MQTATTFLSYMVVPALIFVAGTLFVGLFSMARGGEFNRRWGNILMRLRVGSQAVAIALLVAYFLLTRL